MDSTDSLFETLLVMSSVPPRQARVVAIRQVEAFAARRHQFANRCARLCTGQRGQQGKDKCTALEPCGAET